MQVRTSPSAVSCDQEVKYCWKTL